MKKIARIIALIAIFGIITAGIIASFNHKVPNSEKVWDQATTVGNIDAKNYFIVYSDIVCPYCVAFENAIIEHEEEFKKYLEDHDILFEVRVSEFLYRYGESQSIASHYGSEAIYCAKQQGRFWDYYNSAITKVWNEYFKTYGKAALSLLSQQDKNYWISIGTDLGLNEDFANCVKNGETDEEILAVTQKTGKVISGLPAFKFNDYVPAGGGGFSLSGTWGNVLDLFDAGLKKH